MLFEPVTEMPHWKASDLSWDDFSVDGIVIVIHAAQHLSYHVTSSFHHVWKLTRAIRVRH